MAYENYGQGYMGGGYGGYAQPQPPYYASQQAIQHPVTQSPHQYGVPIREVRFVTSEEARAYIVFPNANALLIDAANKMAYLKTADNMGQSVTENFRFEKVNPDGSPIKKAEVSAQSVINTDDFVRKADIENYGFATQAQLNDLLKEIRSLQKKISVKNLDKSTTDEE